VATSDKKLLKHYEQAVKNALIGRKVEATNPDTSFDPRYLEQVRSRGTEETAASHMVSSRPNHSEWFYVNDEQNDYKFDYPEMLEVSSYFILYLR
jgi:hypothetical protein